MKRKTLIDSRGDSSTY